MTRPRHYRKKSPIGQINQLFKLARRGQQVGGRIWKELQIVPPDYRPCPTDFLIMSIEPIRPYS